MYVTYVYLFILLLWLYKAVIEMCIVQCSRRCTAVVALIGATCRAVKHSCLMKANWQRNSVKPASVTLCIVPELAGQGDTVVCVCVCLVSYTCEAFVCVCTCVCVRMLCVYLCGL